MRYEIVNRGTGILGAVRQSPAKSLGLESEEVRKARELLQKVQNNYQNLASLIGKEAADLAVKQAQENLKKAEAGS
jgi:hypothetical protein